MANVNVYTTEVTSIEQLRTLVTDFKNAQTDTVGYGVELFIGNSAGKASKLTPELAAKYGQASPTDGKLFVGVKQFARRPASDVPVGSVHM